MKTKRNDLIDSLRGIAIFLVILGHSIIYYPINLHNNLTCESIFKFVVSVHIPLFFLVAGYCYSFKSSYKDYICKKIKRLMIPYFIFNFIDMFLRATVTGMINRSRGIAESLYKIFFEGGEYWFLYVLFLIFLLIPVLDKKILKSRKVFLVFILLLFIINLFLPQINFLMFSRFINYLFYFILGFYLKKYHQNIFEIDIHLSIIISMFLVSLVAWILLLPFTNYKIIEILVALIGILCIFAISHINIIVNLFKKFSDYSLQLYLLNGYSLTVSRYIIVNLLNVKNSAIIIIWNMLLDFYVCYIIIKYIISKSKILKKIFGMV